MSTPRHKMTPEQLDRRRAWEREHYARNREKQKARKLAYYHANRELAAERSRRYREANPEKRAETWARWYAKNRERVQIANRQRYDAEVHRAWRNANREKYREIQLRRRARLAKAAGADYTNERLIRARFSYYGNRCRYCGAEGDLEVDHVIPLARGGSHWPANIVPACSPCNKRKNARPHKQVLAALELIRG
jgi:5-methylcytosine-specific restriction endonuclease McrA